MKTKNPKNLSAPKPGFFAGISVFSGFGALAAKSCCILPFLLASSGIGSAWLSRELAALKPYFLTAAIVTLLLGWFLVLRRNREGCQLEAPCSIAKAGWPTFTMLGLATVLVGLSAIWDVLQPVLLAYLKTWA